MGDDAAARFRDLGPATARSPQISHLVVVDRPGEAVVELPEGYPWIHVEVPRLDVSSTDLRARCADGRPLDYLVTEPVLEVIRRLGIYQEAA